MKRKSFPKMPYPQPELAPRKQLGQHFLRDSATIDAIVRAIETHASTNSAKYAHEIGPGEGVLTRPLLEKGWNLTCLEKDPRSVELLTKDLVPLHPGSLHVVQTDILRWRPESENRPSKPLCIGNIPYYITSDILLWLCANRDSYCAAVFMVQKEVAERLVAEHGNKEYGRLSVRMQLTFSIRTLLTVPARAFFPPPKVDSAVIELRPTGFSLSCAEEERLFDQFTATLFSARRKMLRRGLAQFLEIRLPDTEIRDAFWKLAASLEVHPETRPDAIPPHAILALHRFLWQNTPKHQH